jgi:hypothetical protein
MAIVDSGSRTEFESGAVRDIQKGKGRCDLLPFEVLMKLYWGHNDDAAYIMACLSDFVDSGNTKNLKDALERFTKISGLTLETMLLEVSIHFEEGAEKYGENNWQKGLPAKCYINSAARHFFKYLRGDDDERHDRAFVWNVLCLWWTCVNIPELNEYKKKKEDGR